MKRLITNIIFAISVAMTLFLNNNLAYFIGIKQILSVTTTPLFLFCLFTIFSKKAKNDRITRNVYGLFFISALVLVFKISIGQYSFIKELIYIGFLQGVIVLAFEKLSITQRKILKYILILFFLTVSGITIVEWFTKTNFFFIENEYYTSTTDIDENWAFRSQAFFGHPLYVSMIMTFMLIMLLFSKLKFEIKIILSISGFLSLLCINSRTGIVLSFALFLPTLYYNLNNMNKKVKIWFLLVVMLLCISLIYIVFNTELGGRLIGYGKDDGGSAMQRLITFSIFDIINKDFLLFGDPDFTDKTLQLFGWVENGYIAFILKYGLIAGLPLLAILINLHISLLRRFSKIGALCIAASFYVYAFSNPHLVNPNLWFYFLMSYYGTVPYVKKVYEKQ